MTTVGDLVEQVIRDWLVPPDDQPVRAWLTSAISETATSLTYDASALLPEEEFLLAPGTLIEIGLEQMIITTISPDGNTMTVRRHANRTTAVPHDADAVILARPPFARRTVYDAVCNAIVGMYPRLHRRRAHTVSIGSYYTVVPEDVEQPESFMWLEAGVPQRSRIQVLEMPEVPTGKAMLTLDAPAGSTGTLIYRARFPRPTGEHELLDHLGVFDEMYNAVVIKAVSHVVAARDLDNATTEYLTRQLEAQAVEPMSGNRLREALLRYYEYEMGELSRQNPAVAVKNGWVI